MSLRFAKATIAAIAVILASSLAQTAAKASDALDIQSELSMPGVKLVVVEFYATWCKPCMEAVPEWKKIHDKYRKQGLRFIVVSADEGKCSKPPEWTPDATYCDIDGVLQKKYGVLDLPTSLLFSWEGNVSVRARKPSSIEEAIVNYLKGTQLKIVVDQVEVIGDKYAISSNPIWVRNEIISNIRSRSKFDVVTSSDVPIRRVDGESCSPSFPPNSTLRITLAGDDKGARFVSLQLEKDGCVKASVQNAYKGKGMEEDKASLIEAVKQSVDQLISQVIKVKSPAQITEDGAAVVTFRNTFDDDGRKIRNPVIDKSGYLFVESEPSGARVLINGEEKGKTPFQTELMIGDYVVICDNGALWIPARQRVALTPDGAKMKLRLGPNYGILKVESQPTGADILINSEPTGQKTPYTFPLKKAGEYTVTLNKDMYLSKTMQVQLGDGKTVGISERLDANFGSIKAESTPLGASIIIDGTDTGQKTPATVSPVAVGVHDVTLRLASHNDYKKKLKVDRGQVSELVANLTGQYGLLKIEAWVEKDGQKQPVVAAVFIDGKQVGETPYKKEMLVGIYKMELKAQEGIYNRMVNVQEGQEEKVAAVLKNDIEGVWTDKNTEKMWQNPPAEYTMDWQDAVNYCENLNLGGYSGWHLPEKNELWSLLTENKYNSQGCFWPEGLSGECSWYWSSSAEAYVDAWYMSFYLGKMNADNRTTSRFVRCVRSGP